MINPNMSAGERVPTTRECLVELNKLIPKSEAGIASLTDPQKVRLQGMITDVLQKVQTNEKSFTFDQRANLMNIRNLAKRAEKMHLLSAEGKAAIQEIAAKTKAIGLSLYASPKDAKLETADGIIEVNSEVLVENSDFFKQMFEEINEINVPVDHPTTTVNFLMELLHAPENEQLGLPQEKEMIPGLLRFAAGYGFDKLIQKLEPAITQYLTENPNALATHTEEWLSALHQVNKTHPEAAGKWFDVITPHFLEQCNLPVKKAGLPGHFEVSIDHLNAFLEAPTRDLLKYFPLVIEIKNEDALDYFKKTIQTTKLIDPLDIKLLCKMSVSPDDKKSLQLLAKASNINLDIEKNLIPPGTLFFGKKLWDKYLGEVDDVPLPEGIGELLESEIIMTRQTGEVIHTGIKWKEKFMLVLLPKTVDGEPLTLNRFRELAQHPKGEGHAAKYPTPYEPIFTQHGNNPLERSAWVLMTTDVIDGSLGASYEKQQAVVASLPNCEFPDLLSAHVAILTHFIHTGERLYGGEPSRYIYCKERINGWSTVVGYFEEAGLDVNDTNFEWPQIGAGALRKFVP